MALEHSKPGTCRTQGDAAPRSGSFEPMDDREHSVATRLHRALGDLPEGTFVLRVVSGASIGASLELDGSDASRVLVGTSSVCALRLTDPGVSRRHLALELRGARLRMIDLGSTNGTFVGELRVVEALLAGGETVRVGDTLLAIERRTDGRNAPVPPGTHFGRLVGASRAMRRLYPLCARLAASAIPIVIEGETGTGKEVLAEALHEEGPRSGGPFCVFDCTAVPPSLVESELFGHERGAFTGATAQRRGIFEQASGGTLLIDEIGDLEPSLQPKLLRAIERGEVRRVGGQAWLRVDVRIIAATRRDLDQEVQAGRFRDDLFHRLAVGRIELPPLRERTGDVVLLASQLWKTSGGHGEPPPALLARWSLAPWPGNVRELKNAVARAIALGDEATLGGLGGGPETSDGGDATVETAAARSAHDGLSLAAARARIVEVFERRYLEAILAKHADNVTHASVAAGVARRHFQRLRAKTR